MKLRMNLSKQIIATIILVAIIAIGVIGVIRWINSPKYGLRATNVNTYSIRKETSKWVWDSFTEKQQKEIDAWRKQQGYGTGSDFNLNSYIDMLLKTPSSNLDNDGMPLPPNFQGPGHYEYSTYETGKDISGELMNRANREFSHIVIEFVVYDKDSYQVGTFNVTIDNLQPHSKIKFNKTIPNNLYKASNYNPRCEVTEITAY